MTVALDVVVDVDLGALPQAHLEALGRQRPQRGRVQHLEGAASTTRQLLERALIQIDQQRGDRPVAFVQAEEAPVAQARQNPSLDHEHRVLDLRLVARMSRACREQRTQATARLPESSVTNSLIRDKFLCAVVMARCKCLRTLAGVPLKMSG
ncbi:hypothetical protein J2W35_003490 [Variovorax boronicumulans]|nr:hypothetical protein [Variovorax boronicumulans]